MELSDIKRGDILVIKCNDIVNEYQFERDYIIFIASGFKIRMEYSDSRETMYIISAIASIDLNGTFNIGVPVLSIGFAVFKNEPYKTSEIRKPTVNEVLEILNQLRAHGLKYNRKTKNIEKLWV